VELELDVTPAVALGQREALAVPADALWMITLVAVGILIERLLDDEIVRQVEDAPAAIVILGPRWTGRRSGLRIAVSLAGLRVRQVDIAAIEAPTFVKRQAVADSSRMRRDRRNVRSLARRLCGFGGGQRQRQIHRRRRGQSRRSAKECPPFHGPSRK